MDTYTPTAPMRQTYDLTTETVSDAIAQVQALIAHPPTEGYGAGFKVVQLVANNHPHSYDGRNPIDDPTDYTLAVDPEHPYHVTSVTVEHWEQLTAAVADLTNNIEGMTQALVIVRV